MATPNALTKQPEKPTIPGPDPDTRKPKFKLPPLSCDCHAHVFGPQSRYRYAPTRGYVPPDARPADYVRMLRALGCERAVLVQPSVYGTDNSAMLDAMKSGLFSFRGVAVIDEKIRDEELAEMHRIGVRGVRLNVASRGSVSSLDQAPRLAARIQPFGWHLQFFVEASRLADIHALLNRLPVDVVIDHFGSINPAEGLESPGFKALLNLLKSGHCWVKLSAAYRLSKRPPLFPDVTPFARALVAAEPDRLVWATDWPHPTAPYISNDGDLADLLLDWIPDEAVRKKVLVDNPAQLYGFEKH